MHLILLVKRELMFLHYSAVMQYVLKQISVSGGNLKDRNSKNIPDLIKAQMQS